MTVMMWNGSVHAKSISWGTTIGINIKWSNGWVINEPASVSFGGNIFWSYMLMEE